METNFLEIDQNVEQQKHKAKRMIPSPNSYFMEVRCPGCKTTLSVFSHAQTQISCNECNRVIGKPTGGKIQLSEGVLFKPKK